jgi:hypothetical protein
VSITPLSQHQRCQWHRWGGTSSVIDTAKVAPALSLTPLRWHQRCHWHRWWDVILNQVCIAESAKVAPAVSLTRLMRHQRSQWHCWCGTSGVNDAAGAALAVSMTPLMHQLCQITSRIWSHIQKYFDLLIRGPGGIVWWKKTRGQKSCDTVPLSHFEYKFVLLEIFDHKIRLCAMPLSWPSFFHNLILFHYLGKTIYGPIFARVLFSWLLQRPNKLCIESARCQIDSTLSHIVLSFLTKFVTMTLCYGTQHGVNSAIWGIAHSCDSMLCGIVQSRNSQLCRIARGRDPTCSGTLFIYE